MKKLSSQDLLILRKDLVTVYFNAKKNKAYGAMSHNAEKIVSVERELHLRKVPFDKRPNPAIYPIVIASI